VHDSQDGGLSIDSCHIQANWPSAARDTGVQCNGSVSELWFHTCPECITMVVSGSGGATTGGLRGRSQCDWQTRRGLALTLLPLLVAAPRRTSLTTTVIHSEREYKPPF